ncbi:sensor histidine kinase [Methylobacterium nodulans]|uniref:Histidine kinase n=1 Tax=Methylobacterium nodulans (strain LMG 21967 / CNCM I-2342 / ORS 2060) TaxID=460265 RepID=B8ILM6_METNO|nr:histidine kinase [Methylobacterium nodulans]ACL62001.1 histidine kinase [Methylobacterium nodulans ORS 2060]
MSLLARLALHVLLAAALCLAGGIAFIVVEVRQGLQAEAETSARRIAEQYARQPGLGSAGAGPAAAAEAHPEGHAAPPVLAVLPGICAEVALAAEAPRRLCGGWEGWGEAPGWFRAAVPAGSGPPAMRSIVYRGRVIGVATAWPEAAASAGRAWRQVRDLAGIAAGMVGATMLLIGLAAGRLLAPAGRIVDGLRALEAGHAGARLPAFTVREFDRIAAAFNTMAERLARTEAERRSLTLRLFQVQEEERRALARDLHDEFGQCLTATGALAETIAAEAADGRPDLRADALAIGRNAARMMETLRGALARLEPPEIEELGLEGSLRALVAGWGAGGRPGTEFHIDVVGDLADVPPPTALSLYRIAQEFLTNAVRHGRPGRVFLRVLRAPGDGRSVTLVVDDDGGGDAGRLRTAPGRGLLGVRERIAALGGRVSITGTGTGIRACAVVPMLARGAP